MIQMSSEGVYNYTTINNKMLNHALLIMRGILVYIIKSQEHVNNISDNAQTC